MSANEAKDGGAALNAAQLCVLRHALGLDDRGRGTMYRGHFVTGEGSDDFPHCAALVEAGFMQRRAGSALTGGDDLFLVTPAGRAKAREAQP